MLAMKIDVGRYIWGKESDYWEIHTRVVELGIIREDNMAQGSIELTGRLEWKSR